MQVEFNSINLPNNSHSLPILIKSKNINKISEIEYDLICNNFDPNKCSPPDEWSERLLKRLGFEKHYNSSLRRASTYRSK